MEPVAALSADHLDAVRVRRAELRESMTALEQALAAAAPGREAAWAQRVHVALVELSADLRAHVQLSEAKGGLYDELVDASPRLAGRVARLVRDHADIARLVEDLIAQAGAAVDDAAVAAVRTGGMSLLGRLARHRQATADVFYEAYQTDVGGET